MSKKRVFTTKYFDALKEFYGQAKENNPHPQDAQIQATLPNGSPRADRPSKVAEAQRHQALRNMERRSRR